MRTRLVLLMGACLLAACDQGPAPDAISAPQERVVIGVASKGPLRNAEVRFFSINADGSPGLALDRLPDMTDASGAFMATGLPADVALLAVTTGGDFVDESDINTGPGHPRKVALGTTEGFVSVLAANATKLAITPYTQALYLKARRQAAGTEVDFLPLYNALLTQVDSLFGLDVTTVLPADPLNPQASFDSQAQQYAMLLGGAANAINAIALKLGRLPDFTIIKTFIEDLSDGALDGQCGSGACPPINGRTFPADVDLNNEVRRFRNNNFDNYQLVSLAFVDEFAFSAVINTLPVAVDDAYSTPQNTLLELPPPGILLNDTDADGDSLTAILVTGPGNGALQIFDPDGHVHYQPNSGFTGTDSFTYRASDGELTSNTATVTITVTGEPAPVVPAFVYFPYDIEPADGGGAFVVKSSDFITQVLTVETPGSAAAPTSTFHTTDFQAALNPDGSLASLFQDRMAYIKGGQLFYVGLRDTDSPDVPTPFSSETAALNVCRTKLSTLSPGGASRDAWFIYKLPGGNGLCDDDISGGDDVVKAAKLSFGTAGGPGSDPITLPGHVLPGGEFNSTSGAADTLGYLMADTDNGALNFYNASFASPQPLITSGVTGIRSDNPGRINQALVEIFSTSHELRIVSVDNAGLAAMSGILYTFRTGFEFQHGEVDSGFYYFAERPACCETVGTSRILKVPVGGSVPATLVYETSGNGNIFQISLTANKIVFIESPATGGSIALKMLDKSATAPSTPVVVTNNSTGFVETNSLGQQIVYTEVTPGTPNNGYRAFVKNESNAVTFDGLASSVWAGAAATIAGTLTSGFTDTITHGLLVQGVTNFDSTGVLGGTLKALDLGANTLGGIIHTFSNSSTENRHAFIFIERKGPGGGTAGLGELCSMSSPSFECDIIAVDIGATPRYARITTTAVRERRVDEGGQQGGGGPPPPPANDNFANATEVLAPSTTNENTAGATTEAGEPQPCLDFFEIGATVWHSFVPGTNGTVIFDTEGSNFDTEGSNYDPTLAIYTGTSLDALTNLACDDDSGTDLNAFISIPVTAGITYWIQAGGYFGSVGALRLNVDFDNDGDGLSNAREASLGTNPNNPDTDGDGLQDGAEVNVYGSNPLVADSDGDGLSDGDEVNTHFTNPTNPDTDGDTFNDGAEVTAGSDPLNPADRPGNDAPVANNDSYFASQNTPLTVPAPGVLANDSDVDVPQQTLTAVLIGGTTNGTVNLNADGSFTYTPAASFTGTDSFTYQATDGTLNSNTATVFITVAAAAATFPRDFLMPYGVVAGPSGFSSAVGVSAADFAQTLTLTGAPFDSGMVVRRFDFSGGVVSNERPFALVYHQGGKWMRVLLGLTDDRTPVQISSEDTPTICEQHADFGDLGNPLLSYVLYRVPGVNNTCGDADDVFRTIRLSDSAATAPITANINKRISHNPAFFNDAGQLVKVLGLSGTDLVALDASFQNPVVLLSGVTSVDIFEFIGVKATMLAVDNTLRRVSLNTADNSVAVSAPLHTLAAGESFKTDFQSSCCNVEIHSATDNANLYFTVTNGTFGGATNTRLFRVARDGSGNAVEMFSFAGGMLVDDVTTNKVVFETFQASTNTHVLRTLDRTATAPSTPTDLQTDVNGFPTNVTGVGSRVFFNILNNFDTGNETTTAKIVNDDGSGTATDFANSKFVGGVGTFTFDLTTETLVEAATHFLLAEGATSFNTTRLQGATLKSFKVADGSTVTLTTITENAELFANDESGPVGLGVFNISTGPGTFQNDVFAYDAEQGRFTRLTTTSAQDERPID